MSGAKTPLLDAVLQGNMDAAGYKILNLDLSGLASGAPFFDNTALVRGSVDGTKLAHFDLSLIGSAQHRVFQLPNYNGRVATVAGTEDLTNKTINGITFGGTGGISLADGIIDVTGELVTNGNLAVGSGHDLRLDTTASTHVVLPIAGTLATTAQLPVISDAAYDATSWNNNLEGASKNAIRDKFESLTTELPPFSDQKQLFKNDSDPTKLVKLNLAGLTTGTTRTYVTPNKNGTLALLDDIPFTAGILFGSDQDGRSLSLAGDVAFYGVFTLAGGFPALFNISGVTDINIPETGTLATWDGAETLTNKTIVGGSATQLSELSILPIGLTRSLKIDTSTSGFTSDRTFNLFIPNADTSLTLGNNFSTIGNFPIALTATASTALTLPAIGTLVAWVTEPASSSASGTPGQAAYKDGKLYVCYDTNAWGKIDMDTSFP